MKDKNGIEIRLGDRAVVLKGNDFTGISGKIGTIRQTKERVGCLRNKPGVQVTDGPPGDWNWSAWCRPEHIVVVTSGEGRVG